jgi:hypothetical protein
MKNLRKINLMQYMQVGKDRRRRVGFLNMTSDRILSMGARKRIVGTIWVVNIFMTPRNYAKLRAYS